MVPLQDVILKVSEVAGKEHGIEKNLAQMKDEWKEMQFEIQVFACWEGADPRGPAVGTPGSSHQAIPALLLAF